MEEKSSKVSIPDTGSVSASRQEAALLGFRGVLAIQTIIYIVFEIFFPTAVAHSSNNTGPQWQRILRTSVSIFLWNPSLIRAALIILSARTICLPFLESPSSVKLASAIFRRPFRLFFPLSVALAITTIVNNTIKTTYLDHFKDLSSNVSLPTPYQLPIALTYFNAMFTLFWTVRSYTDQAASRAFYNNSLWAISVIYTQSYTVYLAAVIIPYTRPKWRLYAWTFFILTAWWVQSWAWYSISGLLLADAAIHMQLRDHMVRGMSLGDKRRALVVRIPGWVLGVFLLLAGGTLQFFWKEWRPTYSSSQSDVAQPQAREDDFLLVMGVMVLFESLPWLRRLMGNRVFVAIGKRSLSKYNIAVP
jgi:hypothetical protein